MAALLQAQLISVLEELEKLSLSELSIGTYLLGHLVFLASHGLILSHLHLHLLSEDRLAILIDSVHVRIGDLTFILTFNAFGCLLGLSLGQLHLVLVCK